MTIIHSDWLILIVIGMRGFGVHLGGIPSTKVELTQVEKSIFTLDRNSFIYAASSFKREGNSERAISVGSSPLARSFAFTLGLLTSLRTASESSAITFAEVPAGAKMVLPVGIFSPLKTPF